VNGWYPKVITTSNSFLFLRTSTKLAIMPHRSVASASITELVLQTSKEDHKLSNLIHFPRLEVNDI